MVNHIMQQAGRKPGMVCTDGVFVDGQEIDKGDKCADAGHLKVLTNTDVDIAVLETHHAGIMFRGFCFDWCDIAVCLNVTEDHLGVNNVSTVEQMAEVKRALPERARHAAILYADDEHCLAMADKVDPEKLCLVSMKLPAGHQEEVAGSRRACFCVLEQIDGTDWMVIHDEGERCPVMPVNAIPATFNGSAGFNVSNAMHAMLASYLAGAGMEAIRSAMGCFECGYANTPGRLNVFDDLPFRIVMDFAHNADGMRLLCEFTDQQTPVGRKLIAFSGTVDRLDDSIRNMGRSVAGHFDFYICKEYVHHIQKNPRKVAHLLKQGLMQGGVAEEQLVVMGNGKEVMFEIFDMCGPGDLLVMLLGHVEKHQLPGYIEEYAGKPLRS
jgi:cyanophycin synthetase